MRIIEISKGPGKGKRVIYAPNEAEMKALKAKIPALNEIMVRADKCDVQHGFRYGRSPLTNAKCHIGYDYTLTMDLKDFFDSVSLICAVAAMSAQVFADNRIKECLVDGAARQGLPTSPLLANIAASPMDNDIMALRGKNGRFEVNFVYTRYADDLTFSFNEYDLNPQWLREQVEQIAQKHGFNVNQSKTKLQSAKAGRRIITGIAVDYKAAYPTRRMKRRFRAAKHQRNTAQARGLAEWLRLRMPKGYIAPDVKRWTAPKIVKTATPTTKPGAGNRFIESLKRQFDL